MNFIVLTIFPEMFNLFWEHGIIKRAIDGNKIFGSAITTGGLTAIFLNIVLPESLREQSPEGGAYGNIKTAQALKKP